jgi:type IV pilus assembly protein PilN
MIRINLLPVRAAKKRESVRFQLTVAGLITFFVIALGAVLYFISNSEANALREDIARGEAELSELKKKIGELSKIKEQKRIVESKLQVVKKLEAARKGPVDLFTRISEAIPKKVWLNSLVDSGRVITLKGFAATEDDVSMFLRGLEKHKELGRPELVVAQRRKKAKIAGRELVEFTIRLEK